MNGPHIPFPVGSSPVTGMQGERQSATPQRRKTKPIWNRTYRSLIIADQVVKQFTWPAANQELILDAFHEEDWPARIDDPLPRTSQVCPKRRLHDTIKCLNRKRISRLIRFFGDGTGEGICWEFVKDANTIS